MSGRSFLDTNIFIYAVDQSDTRKAAIAVDLIREHAVYSTGVISFQVVHEFFNVAFKRFPAVMPPEEASQFLAVVFAPLLSVHSSVALCDDAMRIYRRFKLSWYDSLIVAAAAEARCGTLYSEDMQHGAVIQGIRIENPFLVH
jgi:predicted nucleic acid-binding protein